MLGGRGALALFRECNRYLAVTLLPMTAPTNIVRWCAWLPVQLSIAIANTRYTKALLTTAYIPTLVIT